VSKVSEVANVQAMMADYAAIDQTGKINIIGGTVAVVSQQPGSNVLASFALVVSVTVPPSHYGSTCRIDVVLEDASGEPVYVPGLAAGAPPQPLAFQQTATFEKPRLPPSVTGLRDYLPSRVYTVVIFPTGLPLPEDRGYQWRIIVDEETRDDWRVPFVVSAQSPPSSIPPVPEPI
jgi:hypothetical protein